MNWHQKDVHDLLDPQTFVYEAKPILVIGIVQMQSKYNDERGTIPRILPGWMADVTRAASDFMDIDCSNEDANSVNNQLQLSFMMQINPDLIACCGRTDGMSPIIADALTRLADKWQADISWQSIGYSDVIVTIANLLKSFKDQQDGISPTLLSFSNPRDLTMQERDWNDDNDAFSRFVVNEINMLIDRDAVRVHMQIPFIDCMFEPGLNPTMALS